MRLEQVRAKRKWSQPDLAAKVSLSREYVARLETGHHDPPLSMLRIRAKALKVTVGALVE